MEGSWQERWDEAHRLHEEVAHIALQATIERQPRLETMAQLLDGEKQMLREREQAMTGKIEDVLVHRFGGEIIRNPERIEAYLDLAKRVEAAANQGDAEVPVMLVRHTVLEDEDVYVSSEMIVVDPIRPFCSDYWLIDSTFNSNDPNDADSQLVEFGLFGNSMALQCNVLEGESVDEDGLEAYAGEKLLLNSEETIINQSEVDVSPIVEHSEKLPDVDLIALGLANESVNATLLVGWTEIEAAAMKHEDMQKRRATAKWVCYLATFIMTTPSSNAPRLSKAFNAIKQEDSAFHTITEALKN